MKYLLIIFLLTCKIPLFGQKGNDLHVQASKVTYQCQLNKIEVNRNIRSALREVREQGSLCFPYMKDSIFYLVSVSERESYIYLFVRPYYYFEAPDLRECKTFGAITIDNTLFYFYGLNNKLLFKTSKKGKMDSSFKFTTDTSLPLIPILCDGCSQLWVRKVHGAKILVDAEICNANAMPQPH